MSLMTRVPKADHSNKNCRAKRRPPPFRRLELYNEKKIKKDKKIEDRE